MVRRRAPRGAKLNVRQKRQVKRLIGNRVEDKIIDTALASATVGVAGSVNLLTLPQQGTGPNQRVGEEITLKKLSFNYRWLCVDSTNVCRLIVFRWDDNNAVTTPIVSDVYQSSTPGPLVFWNDTNHENGRIHVLYDKMISMSLNGNANYVRKASVYGTKLGRKKLVFNPGVITCKGAIYYCIVSDSVLATDPQFDAYWRLNYTDA